MNKVDSTQEKLLKFAADYRDLVKNMSYQEVQEMRGV